MVIKAEDASYNNYMRGAKVLAKWLEPIDKPVPPKTPVAPIARTFVSYEVWQLAKILYPHHINFGIKVILSEIKEFMP